MLIICDIAMHANVQFVRCLQIYTDQEDYRPNAWDPNKAKGNLLLGNIAWLMVDSIAFTGPISAADTRSCKFIVRNPYCEFRHLVDHNIAVNKQLTMNGHNYATLSLMVQLRDMLHACGLSSQARQALDAIMQVCFALGFFCFVCFVAKMFT